MDKALQNATITITKLIGQQVRQLQNVSGQGITIQRDNLLPGMYSLFITQNNKNTASTKIMIAD